MAVYWIGVAGYIVIDPDLGLLQAIYMVTITLSTVGYREVVHDSGAAQTWTILIIVVGGLTVAVAGGSLVGMLVEGEVGRLIGSRKLESRIKHLNGHTVICGFGRMGQLLVERLLARNVPLVIVENQQERILAAEQLGCLYVRGDATEETILEQAGVARARNLVAALASDADNLFVTLTARQMRPVLHIVARAENSSTEPKLRRAGADRVISPQSIGAERIATILTHPHVVDFVDVAAKGVELEMEEIEVTPDSVLAGKSLREADIRRLADVMVVAIRRADGTTRFSPGAEEVVRPGDMLITIGQAGAALRLAKMRIIAEPQMP